MEALFKDIWVQLGGLGLVIVLLIFAHIDNKKTIAKQGDRIDALTQQLINEGKESTKIIAANNIIKERIADRLEEIERRLPRGHK